MLNVRHPRQNLIVINLHLNLCGCAVNYLWYLIPNIECFWHKQQKQNFGTRTLIFTLFWLIYLLFSEMAYHTQLWRSPIQRDWRSCAISPICWVAHSRRNSCFQYSAMRMAPQTFAIWVNFGAIGCHRKHCTRSRRVCAGSTCTFAKKI